MSDEQLSIEEMAKVLNTKMAELTGDVLSMRVQMSYIMTQLIVSSPDRPQAIDALQQHCNTMLSNATSDNTDVEFTNTVIGNAMRNLEIQVEELRRVFGIRGPAS
ncbi:MAG: hypothetical protein AB3N28_15385 [Kordiimonas sp.]